MFAGVFLVRCIMFTCAWDHLVISPTDRHYIVRPWLRLPALAWHVVCHIKHYRTHLVYHLRSILAIYTAFATRFRHVVLWTWKYILKCFTFILNFADYIIYYTELMMHYCTCIFTSDECSFYLNRNILIYIKILSLFKYYNIYSQHHLYHETCVWAFISGHDFVNFYFYRKIDTNNLLSFY